MKKRIIVLLTCIAIIFAAVGCGSTEKKIEDFESYVYFSQKNPNDVDIRFVSNDTIANITVDNKAIDSDKYEYSEQQNKLTVKKTAFASLTSGEKKIIVRMKGGSSATIKVLIIKMFINSVTDFDYIREDLTGTYMLGSDIDFAGYDFAPICSVETEGDQKIVNLFSGIFDGNGYALKNIRLERYEALVDADGVIVDNPFVTNPDNYNTGIFQGLMRGGVIKNTAFLNCSIKVQGLGGTVVGVNDGTIENCYVDTNLTMSASYVEHSGGITAINAGNGIIKNCISKVTAYGANNFVNGISGWNIGVIQDCVAGDVTPYHNEAWQYFFRNISVEGYYEDEPGEDGVRDLVPAGAIYRSKVVPQSGLRNIENFKDFDENIWILRDNVTPMLKNNCSVSGL